ncbi:MAG: triose-phosphate isomerase [Mariprofundales bacterium]
MIEKRCLIAGNWKMNGLQAEAESFLSDMEENLSPEHVEVALMPPFTLLHPLRNLLHERGIRLGAQNVYYEPQGAFTGSISPIMLRDAGCHYVILGHSERRHIMGESNKIIRAKLDSAWKTCLEPILCIGETLEERQSGNTEQVLAEQLSVLKGFAAAPLTIAYEPVWAIGTGVTATVQQVIDTHAFVHQTLADIGHPCRVLYGGSVKPQNAAELLSCAGVDGALVGGASLKADSFSALINIAAKVAS